MSAPTRTILESIEHEYRQYQRLAEAALAQLGDDELSRVPAPAVAAAVAPSAAPAVAPGLAADVSPAPGPQPDTNSIAILVWHLSGNLRSRFTDFLTSDGEKPWRERESEFDARHVTCAELLERWEQGWAVLWDTLGTLDDDALHATVAIRGERMPVHRALLRLMAHAAYHVGQIVYLARLLAGPRWRCLSIPRPNPNPNA